MDKRADYLTRYGPDARFGAHVRVFSSARTTWVLVGPVGEGEPLEWCRQIAAAVLTEHPWIRAALERRQALTWLFLSHSDARLAADEPLMEVRFRNHRVEHQAPWEAAWQRRIGKLRSTPWFLGRAEVEAAIGEPLVVPRPAPEQARPAADPEPTTA